jgi:hypothetical protein
MRFSLKRVLSTSDEIPSNSENLKRASNKKLAIRLEQLRAWAGRKGLGDVYFVVTKE